MHVVVVTWLLAGAAAPAGRISDAQASEQTRITTAKGRAAAGGAGPHSRQIEAQPASQASPFASRRTLSFSHRQPVPGRGTSPRATGLGNFGSVGIWVGPGLAGPG